MNREQRAASAGDGGVTLVVAGAGTGKTTTMLEKIINTVESGITTPDRTLIMTFSKKAAEEIKERLKSKNRALSEIVFAGTFHSFGLNILKHYTNEYLKIKNNSTFPAIIDDDKREETTRNFIMQNPDRFLGIPCDAVLALAGQLDSLNPYMIQKLKNSSLLNELYGVSEQYDIYKKNNNLIDYEDMINDAALLLETNPLVREELHKKFNYIFVDEFQDTSENNLRLLKLILPERNKNLFMVGDDYQSIYKFRNAKVEYLVNIKKYFPEVSIIKLTINYRSRKEIVNLSNRFIRLNKFRTNKIIKSAKGGGGKIFFHRSDNALTEVKIIEEIISSYPEDKKIGILYRNNYQGGIIRKKLSEAHNRNIEQMTMHASKGLEFDIVIIAGISDRIIPDRSSDIEEERRLFYVAMTRAMNELHLIYMMNNNGRFPRFIWELGLRENH